MTRAALFIALAEQLRRQQAEARADELVRESINKNYLSERYRRDEIELGEKDNDNL